MQNSKEIEEAIDEKMDQLIGKGDYNVMYVESQDRFIVSFRSGDVEECREMAEAVVDHVNAEQNILRIGNYNKVMFWLTWVNA